MVADALHVRATFRLLAAVVVLLGAGCHAGAPRLPPAMHADDASPGRFAMVFHQSTDGGCSMSSFSSGLSSSVVLSLEAGGGARGCRGRHWHSIVVSNDGQGQPDVTEYVEQQGLRGTWSRRGPWIDVTLTTSDAECPAVRRGAQGTPAGWKLECIRVLGAAAMPVLACFHEELPWPHDLGYSLEEPFGVAGGDGWDSRRKGTWMLLGEGNGVEIDEVRFGGLHPPPDRHWKAAAAPLRYDAWKCHGQSTARSPDPDCK